MKLVSMISRKCAQCWATCFEVKHLWITNTVSSGVLMAAGDGIQQQVEFRRGTHAQPHYNWPRTARMAVVGLSQGPIHHYFYVWLDKKLPKRSACVIVKKILVDQLMAAPFFAATFIVLAGLLEGSTLRDATAEFVSKFPTIYLFDWFIWPPSQALNFYFVPSEYRVLYVNCITVVWDVFLSYIKHRDQKVVVEESSSQETASSVDSPQANKSL